MAGHDVVDAQRDEGVAAETDHAGLEPRHGQLDVAREFVGREREAHAGCLPAVDRSARNLNTCSGTGHRPAKSWGLSFTLASAFDDGGHYARRDTCGRAAEP